MKSCDRFVLFSSSVVSPFERSVRVTVLYLAGLIAVVIFVTVAGLAIGARFLYRRKETYQNQEVKTVKQEEGPDFPFNNQADSQKITDQNPKEYFI